MRTPKTTFCTLPFADRIPANTFSLADMECLGWVADPRWHDLPEDTHLWLALLAAARTLDGEAPLSVFGALHGLRCMGARLHPAGTGLRLQPGEIHRDEYLQWREQYLVPHADTLRRLLARASTANEVETLGA